MTYKKTQKLSKDLSFVDKLSKNCVNCQSIVHYTLHGKHYVYVYCNEKKFKEIGRKGTV